MNAEDAFLAGLKADGYDEVEHKSVPAATRHGEHRHPWDARLLVVDGELTLGIAGASRTYRPGESFEVAREVPHTERYADDRETQLIVGRRRG
jgi:quercetin dioxygenase-like cupin family protein